VFSSQNHVTLNQKCVLIIGTRHTKPEGCMYLLHYIILNRKSVLITETRNTKPKMCYHYRNT